MVVYKKLISSSNSVLNALHSLLTGCMQLLYSKYGVLPRQSLILDIKIAVWSRFTQIVVDFKYVVEFFYPALLFAILLLCFRPSFSVLRYICMCCRM